MKSFEADTHAFIVRIWLERREAAGKRAEWRGVIEHVRSGERCYLKNLQDITTFIMPYLENMGVKFETPGRTKRWMDRLMCVLTGQRKQS